MFPRHAARLICAASLALSVVVPHVARAQDDATVEMARQRFREGVQFYDQRQYDKARLAFLQAYALKPHPSVLLNLAQSELRAGHPDDASGHFTEYLRLNTEASEAEKQEAELGLAAAKSKVGEVAVTVDVSGAQISVDGVDKGVSPLAGPLFVTPGAHTIDAKSGEHHASKSVTVTAGQATSTSLALRGGAAAAAATTPAAAAATTAPAETPAETESAPLPAEEPRAEAATESTPEPATGGRKPFFQWLGQTPLAMVGVGVTVLGAGGGVIFGALANKDYSSAGNFKSEILSAWGDVNVPSSDAAKLRGSAPCALPADPSPLTPARVSQYQDACKKFQDSASSGDSKKTLAIVSGVVGGAALIGTIVYYFVDPHARKAAAGSEGIRARIVPLSTGGNGLSVVGTF